MEVGFHSVTLRTLCEDVTRATDVLGATVADSLRARLADLRAAEWVGELPVGAPVVSANDWPTVTIRLDGGYELICRVSHPSPARDATGSVDMRRVRRLRVVFVGPRPES